MKKLHYIQPRFKIPRGYRRTFFFEDADSGLRCFMFFTSKGMLMRNVPAKRPGVGEESRCMDWMQEVVETVRHEVEGDD